LKAIGHGQGVPAHSSQDQAGVVEKSAINPLQVPVEDDQQAGGGLGVTEELVDERSTFRGRQRKAGKLGHSLLLVSADIIVPE
jgi:hypothetical protein